MILILQILSIIAALLVDNSLAKYLPCVIPVLYILIIAAGTFSGGSDISMEKLHQRLSKDWVNADEIAAYMKKYWYALKYSISATARQRNCTFLSLVCFGLGIYYFFWLHSEIPAYILGTASVILYLMAMRVNRPLSIYKDQTIRNSLDERPRKEWRLAIISLVAFAELFPDNHNYKFLSEAIQSDELAKDILRTWRLKSNIPVNQTSDKRSASKRSTSRKRRRTLPQ